MLVDLHLHSTASDGSDSPKELAEKLISHKIEIFSLTDHDTIDGIPEIMRAVQGHAKCIPGIEFSCHENGKSCHILGYGFAPHSPEITEILSYSRKLRTQNAKMRLEFLKDEYHITFSDEEAEWFYSQNSPSRLHLAKLLTKNGYTKNNQEAFPLYLNASEKYEVHLKAEDAIKAILSAKAIPIWAHPLGGEGDPHTSPTAQFSSLLTYGLQGLECYYSRYTAKESAYLVSLAEKHHLLISGGSDYHGKNKTVSLAMLSSDGSMVSAEKLSVLTRL